MKVAIALALVACQRTEPSPAVSESSPAPSVVLVGCAPAGERPRVARPVNRKPTDTGDPEELPWIPDGWFPYARLSGSDDRAAPVASRAKAALAERLVDLDLCLTGKTGSVSIMLEVDREGVVTPRVGGIGHLPTERCIADVVKKSRLPPIEIPADIECGLSAGAAGPFRVTVGGYERVVEITSEGVVLDGKPADMTREAPLLSTYLVIAAPDTGAGELALVLEWVIDAPAVLVAVRADGGPPVFVGMAPDRRRGTVKEPRLGVYVTDQTLQSCTGSQRGMASLLEPRRVDAMLGAALAACGDQCDDVVEVGVGGKHTAKQLVGATSGVRRAGRDPVLSIGSRCTK